MFYERKKKKFSLNNIFKWGRVSFQQFFWNSSVLNVLQTQYQQVSIEEKYRGISEILCECPTVNAYHACRVVLCHITVTGNGKILHSTYLLAVKTQKSMSAHFTL